VPDDFPILLRAYRERRGWSCNELARAVGVDPSYVSRLERGEREPPRHRVVVALVDALQLDLAEADGLLVSAGYAPATVALLGAWDPTLEAVARVLVDPALSAADRAAFRDVVGRIAERWQPLPPALREVPYAS
jgi:transcriptional regulator with XRE-family HTH domain